MPSPRVFPVLCLLAALAGCGSKASKTTGSGQVYPSNNGTHNPSPGNPPNSGPGASSGPTSPNPQGGNPGEHNSGGATGKTPNRPGH